MRVSFVTPRWNMYADSLFHQPYWELYYATILKTHMYVENIESVNVIDLRGYTLEDLKKNKNVLIGGNIG